MKNVLIGLFFVASLVFAGLYSHERGRVRQVQKDVATLNQTIVDLQTQVDEQEEQAASLQKHLQNTRATAIAKADQITHLQQVLTNQEAKAATNVSPLAEMFKSPEMKRLIQTQQQTVLGPMIDKNYGAYFATLQMTPEQAATFKDLLLKKMSVGADIGISMLSGDSDPSKRKELMDQAKTQTDALDQQIKEFLGDAHYQQFQTYEKTIPDRMALNSFKDQLGSSAMTADQEQSLLQAMIDERQNFKFTTDFSDQNKFNGDFASMFTEDKINQFQTEQEQLHKQYLARAQGILTPDQLTAFDKFLTSQRDMQAIGMKMAVKMFGKGNGQ